MSRSIEAQVDINRTPEQAFDHVSNVRLLPRRRPGVETMAFTATDPGVGATFRHGRRFEGHRSRRDVAAAPVLLERGLEAPEPTADAAEAVES